jgi:hypothetical protein
MEKIAVIGLGNVKLPLDAVIKPNCMEVIGVDIAEANTALVIKLFQFLGVQKRWLRCFESQKFDLLFEYPMQWVQK